MKAHRFPIIVLTASIIACMVSSCIPHNGPYTYQERDSVLTSGRIEWYGPFYENEGLSFPIVCLDLYSDGLSFNKQGQLTGEGTNLYLSDIFLPTDATQVPEGTYYCDSIIDAMHLLSGINYEGNYRGSYVLLISQTGYQVQLIQAGEMQIRYEQDTLILDGQFLLEKGRTYNCHYRNTIPTIHRER